MKTIQIALLVIIVIGLGLIFTQKYWVQPLTDFIIRKNEEPVSKNDPINYDEKTGEIGGSAVIYCAERDRGADFCTADYTPVCATVEIQCIKAPCNPIQEIFSNACNACKNSLVKSYIAGECQKTEVNN